MKYGILVNVGRPHEPRWQWVHRGPDMLRCEWETRDEAEVQMRIWYPGAKSAVFKVGEICD